MADTPSSAETIANELARLSEYNARAWDAVTNPYGLANDGHRPPNGHDGRGNLFALAADVSVIGAWVAGWVPTVVASADAASDSATAAANSADAAGLSAGAAAAAQGAAETARDLSQAWATGTAPGGPGTRSAREEADRAEAAAAGIAGGPVASVNGNTGVVVLGAADVGAPTVADLEAALASARARARMFAFTQ